MTPVLSLTRLPRLALVMALVSAAPASAASIQAADIVAQPHASALKSGTLTFALTSATSKTLKSAGISLKAVGSAKVKGSSATLKAGTAGIVDPLTFRGTLPTGSGILFAGPKGGVKLTGLTLVRTSSGAKITAVFDGNTVTFGTVSGGAVRSASTKGVLSAAEFKLDKDFAAKIKQATGKSLSGTFATIKAVATTTERPIASGTATLTLDPGILSLLAAGGVPVSAKAPATYATGTATMPILGGALDTAKLNGRLALDGTVTLKSPTATVDLSGWAVIVSPSQKDAFATISPGLAPALGAVDSTGAVVGADGGTGTTVSLSGLKIRFSQLAITTIKSQLGLTIDPNTLLGTVALQGTWAP